MEPFVHLHVHSQYSVLDGQASIETLVSKAMNDGMPGLALTDHGAMFGIKEFYNLINKKKKAIPKQIANITQEIKCLEEKSNRTEAENKQRDDLITQLGLLEKQLHFKGIIGCESYCARRSRHLKDSNVPDPYKSNRSVDSSGWHIILLAKNEIGYHNLIKMISYSWTEGFYYRPRIDKELLEKYHEGIIVSTACLGGEIPQHIINNRIDKAEEAIQWFQNIFGDDFYIELQRHKTNNPLGNQTIFPEQQKVNAVLIELAKKYNVKLIATNDVHFANETDAEAHDRLICLSTGKDINDPNRMRYSKQEWFKTTAEMNEIFADLPYVLSNTLDILNKVEEYSIDHSPLMPDFPIPDNFKDDDDYLRYLTYEGAKRKYGEEGLTPEVRERIDFELNTIKTMGFPGYFLIVQDFIAAARSMGVFVGPGRGSAAGSAVAYCLNITNIDPIKYDLLFERFLNPDRISMPDIDIDFDDDGRSEVLKWVTEKYGKERVAHIITYGTMATKSSIKDVARVLGLPLSESNRLTKLVPDKIPDVKKVTLKEAIKAVPELREASVSPNVIVRDTIKYAQALEGSVRNVGVHACGIIIGKTDINDIVPISTAKDKDTGEDLLVTQYEGSVIEETGLIKMDFLGLKTLSIIKEAILNIKERHQIDIDIDNIPIDDEKTYTLYSEGRTVGTFQFESSGMQKYLKELKPTKFEDLIAMNALYRPGPMEYIPQFIKRKHGIEPIAYDLPCMERYLNDTYGITVYQEQVMLLSREIADFTRGESDTLRKAMGKKLKDKMAALKVKFITGGQKHNYKEDILNKIWADWEKFASYAFNKSHATCYSWVAYQTAYLKANYPAEYMAGALSRNLGNSTEITKLMNECRVMGIKVLVPDVNESNYKFSVNQNGDIRFGLSAIKGVGRSAAEAIINEREANGVFTDVYNFFERINTNNCNRKVIESLILSGGFDTFGIERELYLNKFIGQDDSFLSNLLKYGNIIREDKEQQAMSLFSFDDEAMQIPKPDVPKVTEEFSSLARLNAERELVGVYLSNHPLEPYRIILEGYCNASTDDINNITSLPEGKQVVFGGMVVESFNGITKKNSPYSRIKIEDSCGITEIPFFGDDYINYGKFCREGLFLLIKGVITTHYFRPSELILKVNEIKLLSEVADNLITKIDLKLDIRSLNAIQAKELVDIMRENQGDLPMTITFYDTIKGMEVVTKSTIKIKPTTSLMDYCKDNGIDFYVS